MAPATQTAPHAWDCVTLFWPLVTGIPQKAKKKVTNKGAELKLEPAAGMAEGDTQGSMGTAEAMGHTRSGL